MSDVTDEQTPNENTENMDEIPPVLTSEPPSEPSAEEPPSEPPAEVSGEESELTKVARECMIKGYHKWSSGREREELLKQAGFDPAEVRAEIQRLRVIEIHGEDNG